MTLDKTECHTEKKEKKHYTTYCSTYWEGGRFTEKIGIIMFNYQLFIIKEVRWIEIMIVSSKTGHNSARGYQVDAGIKFYKKHVEEPEIWIEKRLPIMKLLKCFLCSTAKSIK